MLAQPSEMECIPVLGQHWEILFSEWLGLCTPDSSALISKVLLLAQPSEMEY